MTLAERACWYTALSASDTIDGIFCSLQNFTVIDIFHLACGLGTLACLASMGDPVLTMIWLLGGIDYADCRASMLPKRCCCGGASFVSSDSKLDVAWGLFPTQLCSWQQRCLVADCASGGRVCDKQACDSNRGSFLSNPLLLASVETTRLTKDAGLMTGCRQVLSHFSDAAEASLEAARQILAQLQ